MPLIVESRRRSAATLLRRYPGATLVDVTSRGPEPWQRFSPFYPHGDIPVPLSPGHVAASVEGIWQGLKVFERAGVDQASFANATMRGLKRTQRSHGTVLGHRAGVEGQALLSYAQARRQIYLPAYRWVLEQRLGDLVADLRELASRQTVLLLDYDTNCDVDDLSRPLSHAGLVRAFVEDEWPD